jgi:hypothetical protein
LGVAGQPEGVQHGQSKALQGLDQDGLMMRDGLLWKDQGQIGQTDTPLVIAEAVAQSAQDAGQAENAGPREAGQYGQGDAGQGVFKRNPEGSQHGATPCSHAW